MNAPIALFVYNRLDHTKRTIESLKQNIGAKDCMLFIFSDGPKNGVDAQKVNEVRNYLDTITGFQSIKIVSKEKNLGLSKSIISGVTEVINQYGKIIVLEDDMITAKYFLEYMNLSLDKYESETSVCSVHGYMYPGISCASKTFFLKMADCWGWGSWKNRWQLFEPNGNTLLKNMLDKNLIAQFDFDGNANYLRMLKEQMLGINDSWAIRWYASNLIHNKLGLFPSKSLLKNIGTDGSGTHCQSSKDLDTEVDHHPLIPSDIPIQENISVRKQLTRYFYDHYKAPTLLKKIQNRSLADIPWLALKKIKSFLTHRSHYGYFGNYQSWRDAANNSDGYDHDKILAKVKNSLLGVKNGQFAYERDSVAFKIHEYAEPLTTILKNIGEDSPGLSILDFGGSLGSLYYQNQKAFSRILKLEWSIVEQEHFVSCGKQYFEDDHLKFYSTPKECFHHRQPEILILSSVLSYLQDPIQTLRHLLTFDFKWIIIDRTPLIAATSHRLTVQKVPPSIYNYKASYPCWFFDRHKLVDEFNQRYNLRKEFDAMGGITSIKPDGEIAIFKGFVFERKP